MAQSLQKYGTLFFLLIYVWVGVQAGDYHFRNKTADEGLAQNYVDYVYQDSKGFMWFATWCGLDRYDGQEFHHYNVHNSKIASNFTYCLAEDKYRRLWVGTDLGLSVVDLTTGLLIDVFDAVFQYESLFSGMIRSILCDKDGKLWVAGSHGLACILFDDNGKISTVYNLNTLPVQALAEDRNGRLWLGLSSGQLLQLSNETPGRFNFLSLPDCLSQKTFDAFNCLYFDKIGVLWVGTRTGLFRYNPYLNRLDTFVSNESDDSSLPNNTVTDIVQDKTGRIWIGTLSGLALWRAEEKSFECFSVDGTEESINNNYINDLYVDNQNILWIGTDKGGVNWMFEKRKMFNAIKYNPFDAGSILPQPVNAVLEDSKGNLWVGQVEGGLHKRSKSAKKFEHYYHSSMKNSLSQNTVSKIYEDSRSQIWVGTWGGGLNRMRGPNDFVSFDPRNNPEKNLYAPAMDESNQHSGKIASVFVSDIIEDKLHGGLWVAQTNALQFYDFRTERFENVFLSVDMPYMPDNVNCLYIDGQNRLWVGTNIGLYCIYLESFGMRNVSQMQYDYYRYILCDSPIEQLAKIISIHESANGTMWFGTNGEGLYRMEEFKGPITSFPEDWKESYTQRSATGYVRFFNYSTKDGLSDDVIYTIIADDLGSLWMSSNKGLICFNPSDEKCLNFYKNDGLLCNQFYWMSGTKARNGTLYFGNMHGLNSVDPQRFRPNDYMPKVMLLSLRILNEEVEPQQPLNDRIYMDKLISEMDQITIPQKDKSFSIDFTSIDYEFPEKIQYAYMLEGFEDQWNITGPERHSVYYTNLKQGDYTFKVRCSNSDGIWSNEVTKLNIRIKPPFFQTRLFQLLFILSLCGMGYSIVSDREHRLKKSREVLEIKVKERTAELEETYKKVESLTQERISIFTNITHEFKTPITLIRGPIQHLLNQHPSNDVAEQLTMADRNATILLSLVNQIMDFRKIEEGMMSLKKRQVEMVSALRDMVIPFVDEAGKRGIQCLFFSTRETINMMTDLDKIQKVMFNLLSNALKFTPANGSIKVELYPYTKEDTQEDWLHIGVSDTGRGIPVSEREKVFDCFYQVQNNQREGGASGTGIGLYVCRNLMQLLGGDIYVTENFMGGAYFIAEMPIEIADSQKTEVTMDASSPIEARNEVESDENENLSEKPRLLLVEDNADMRHFVISIMQDSYRVLEAQDGEEGWTMAQRYLPNIIISDVMMPHMDGLQLCALVKKTFETSHIPVILLTALSSAQHQLEGLDAGADDYVSKPFDEMVLKAKIRNIMESHEKRYSRFEETMNASDLMDGEQDLDKRLLEKIMTVIEAKYTDPTYDVSSFVRDMNISQSVFLKKIQMLTGQSAGRFIRNYRLNKAKEYLEKKSSRNISEIAYAVGFNDPKYFTRCFTKRYGDNPSHYASSLT